MADQEILSIKIDPGDSADKALNLKKSLEGLEKEAQDLAQAYKAGTVEITEYIDKQAALQKAVAKTTEAYAKQVDAVRKAATQTVSVNASAGGIGPGGSPGGGGAGNISGYVRNIGNLAQDAQYGISAITNNLIQWAPGLGLTLVALDAISKASGGIADGLHSWADSVRSTNEELANTLTISEDFMRQVNWEKAGSWWKDTFSRLGQGQSISRALGHALSPTEAMESEQAAQGRAGLAGILSKEQKDRIKALRSTIEDAGGGEQFGIEIFRGQNKEMRDLIARNLNKAMTTGDETAWNAVQLNLRKTSPLLAVQMDANMPEQKEAVKRVEKEMEDQRKRVEKAEAERARQDDLVDAEFDISNRQHAQAKAKRKQVMTGRSKDALDEMDGLKQGASLEYAQRLSMGQSSDAAATAIGDGIARALEAKGIDKGVAAEQGKDYARGIRRGVEGDIARQAMQEGAGKSQVTTAADQWKLAQEAGVKEQTDLLKSTVEHLAAIRKNGFAAVVGP